MKDFTREELENSRPDIDVLEGIEFCLDFLYRDTEHRVEQTLTSTGLSYEELIGVLLLARDIAGSRN